jgi:hypothetical protein
MFGVEWVGARRVYACTSIESRVGGQVERIPRWNMEGTRDAFKQKMSQSSIGHGASKVKASKAPQTCIFA